MLTFSEKIKASKGVLMFLHASQCVKTQSLLKNSPHEKLEESQTA